MWKIEKIEQLLKIYENVEYEFIYELRTASPGIEYQMSRNGVHVGLDRKS